jgi:lipid A 3-O-deacylase
LISSVALLAGLLGLGGAAQANDLFFKPVTAGSPLLTELRVGATTAAVELNESVLFLPGQVDLRLSNITAEAIFGGIDLDVFDIPGDLRPVLGASLSVNGTDSWAWAGVNYHVSMLEPLFFEFTLGGVVHNGYLDNPPAGRDAYGCRALIYASGGFGVKLSDSMTASLTLDHGSHARLCGTQNPGFNALSFKLGYIF